ncbi:MAG: UDP-2,3-diacylglucosamine diphosphatase [Syntrophaceae bacterium]|nr:UDP-2,3-diacylglucosamine diphosphatase [Syntrophaceae bacterium]
MRAVFFSDVHARDSADTAAACLLEFLAEVAGSLDHLFVAGDLFDFWFSREGVAYPGFQPIIDRLSAMRRGGVRVHLFEGNHDFFLADYFTRHHGIEVYPCDARFVLGGKTLYIAHGDLVDRSDRGYRALRRLLRSPFFYRLQKRMPLPVLWSLARRSSDASKEYLAKPQECLAAKMEDFALAKFAEGFDAVILGHCHLPLLRACTIGGRQTHFALLGDWLAHRSYLVLENGRFELRFWKGGPGCPC